MYNNLHWCLSMTKNCSCLWDSRSYCVVWKIAVVSMRLFQTWKFWWWAVWGNRVGVGVEVLPVEVLRAPGPVESRGRPPSCHRCRTTSTIWLEETRRSPKNHLAENDWGGPTVTEFRGPHGMEEGKGERYLASGRQYGNALLGVRHQEEE